ncbi:fatty acid desaturase [Sphingomonas immobilis]|uniref:Fatty acid desaturase n=1 Tax=Sphingomonas immobilis TaxID=3063997 RepID=A0ABT8ZY42_9SPHN|nr:fatty acid desaturase [Sphingomonas sp. CA1-15]MDO7842044.1 fatty acid desaturase [Sphingomonas sp. CA1-15]
MASRRGRTEWATLAVAAAIYGGWLAATYWHAALPTPLLVAIGAWLIAWHGSLQHETIHGHPTRIAAINRAIGFVPIGLWLPYALYERSHVAHHRSGAITDPAHDPESRYVARAGGVVWLAARAQSTLPGHILIGPFVAVGRFLAGEARRVAVEPVQVARDWLPHLAGVALIVLWLDHVGLGIGEYVATFVYPGMALTMVRSFAEHRAGLGTAGHAASVERAGLFGLLFLNNNLHVAHHEQPGLGWRELPAYHRRHRARLTGEGAILYAGYGEIARRFAWRRHDAPLHPAYAEEAA